MYSTILLSYSNLYALHVYLVSVISESQKCINKKNASSNIVITTATSVALCVQL